MFDQLKTEQLNNLRDIFQAGHSKAHAQRISDWVGQDPQRLGEVMLFFLGDDIKSSQYAAFTVSMIGNRDPRLFYPYIRPMFHRLDKNVHDAVIRCVLQIFQELEFPEDLEGLIFDKCMSLLISPKYPAAFRVYAMNILVNICEKYPELKVEVKPVISDVLQASELPSITSRAKRELKRLEKI